MSRTSLKQRIEGMKVDDKLKVPKDYEESTIRNNASRVGAMLGRKYSVMKDTTTKTFHIIRIS